jgi:hypothetical protein
MYDPRTLWALTGIAVRTGQRLGLHRDGAALGFSVFEVEMRRRLWLNLVVLDARSAELCGTGISVLLWDTELPLNVNDSDLEPAMLEAPIERKGPTEMMFVLIRSEVGVWFKKYSQNRMTSFNGAWYNLIGDHVTLEEKLRRIEELENTFNDKYLRFCDLSLPLHLLVAALAKSTITKMRFVAHMKIGDTKDQESYTQEMKDKLFGYCVSLLEYRVMVQTSPGAKKIIWHIRNFLQWQPFIYLLGDLRIRTSGHEAFKTWELVEKIYDYFPDILNKPKRALFIAVGNLTLKAWDAFEAHNGRAAYRGSDEPPLFIQKLRAQRGINQIFPNQQQQQPFMDMTNHPPALEPSYSSFHDGSSTATSPFTQETLQSFDVLMPSTTKTTTVPTAAPRATATKTTNIDIPYGGSMNIGVGSYPPVPMQEPSMVTLSASMDWTDWDNLVQNMQMDGLDEIDFLMGQ